MQVGFTYEADESLVMTYEPLKAGEYKVRITECKFEPTNDKLGTGFNFKYTVLEGEYKNRKLIDNLVWTWDSSHEKAVNFGHSKFNQILLAIGHQHFAGDTDELIGGEMMVEVGIREYTANDGTLKQTNQVNKWKKIQDGSSTVTNSTPTPVGNVPKAVFGNGAPISNPFGAR